MLEMKLYGVHNDDLDEWIDIFVHNSEVTPQQWFAAKYHDASDALSLVPIRIEVTPLVPA